VSSTVVHVHHDSVQIHRATAQDSRAIADVLTLGFQRSGWIDSLLQPLWHFSLYDDLRHRLVPSSTPYACWLATYDPHHPSSPDSPSVASSQHRLPIATVELSVRPSDTWSRDPWVWQTWPLGSIGLRNCTQYPYIANLAVIASARRLGIARRLLDRCERTARAWGYDRLYLHVLENNAPARSLYQQQGYRPQQVITTPSSLWFKQPRQILLCKILNSRDNPI
jgi:hypothetical protein